MSNLNFTFYMYPMCSRSALYHDTSHFSVREGGAFDSAQVCGALSAFSCDGASCWPSSSTCPSRCFFSLACEAKLLPHCSQFSRHAFAAAVAAPVAPELRRALELEVAHAVHAYGRSPVWMRWCSCASPERQEGLAAVGAREGPLAQCGWGCGASARTAWWSPCHSVCRGRAARPCATARAHAATACSWSACRTGCRRMACRPRGSGGAWRARPATGSPCRTASTGRASRPYACARAAPGWRPAWSAWGSASTGRAAGPCARSGAWPAWSGARIACRTGRTGAAAHRCAWPGDASRPTAACMSCRSAEHLNWRLIWWLCRCCERASSVSKASPHWWQAYRCPSPWLRRCSRRSSVVAKLWLQMEQICGSWLSPECAPLWWTVRPRRLAKEAATQLAGEGDGSAVVLGLVLGQVPRVLEGAVALRAVERPLARVRELVAPHVRCARECPAARVTRQGFVAAWGLGRINAAAATTTVGAFLAVRLWFLLARLRAPMREDLDGGEYLVCGAGRRCELCSVALRCHKCSELLGGDGLHVDVGRTILPLPPPRCGGTDHCGHVKTMETISPESSRKEQQKERETETETERGITKLPRPN